MAQFWYATRPHEYARPAGRAAGRRFFTVTRLDAGGAQLPRRHAEIDIIVRNAATLVFIEVRMRSGSAYGGAAAIITAAKRTKLARTARHYLAALPGTPACRFDALPLDGDGRIE